MHFILHQHRAEYSHPKVGVKQTALGIRRMQTRDEAADHVAPIGVEDHCGNGKNNHQKSRQSEEPLHPLKAAKKQERDEDQGCPDKDQALVPPSEEMNHNCHAAQFSSTGEQVQQIGSNERCESEPLAEPVPHDSKYWFLRHNSNTAAPLHVNNNGDCPETN